MTNNRKPVDEVRLSLSAARRREAGTHLYERLADKDMRDKPYTPPPAVAAWLKAQADKPKAGRDIESLMRYHEAHKKGRTDDDCLAEKFGKQNTGVGNGSCPKIDATASKQGVAPLAPTHSTPPQSAIGGQPLPSAVTKPHGKDVDTADGGTPLIGMFGQERLWFGGMEYTARGRAMPCRRDAAMCWWQNTRTPTIPEMCSWLEQNGHKDAAAQLRGKARADVATGGGRVWRDKSMTSRINLNGVAYGHSLNNRPTIWQLDCSEELNEQCATGYGYTELFGPERDAILAECRKAMGL